jgi:hypothetical protein
MARTRRSPGGHRLWTGGRTGVGYASATIRGRSTGLHRVVWELANGRRMPAGRVAAHRCGIRHCLEPRHIRATTQSENVLEGRHPNAAIHRAGRCTNKNCRVRRARA